MSFWIICKHFEVYLSHQNLIELFFLVEIISDYSWFFLGYLQMMSYSEVTEKRIAHLLYCQKCSMTVFFTMSSMSLLGLNLQKIIAYKVGSRSIFPRVECNYCFSHTLQPTDKIILLKSFKVSLRNNMRGFCSGKNETANFIWIQTVFSSTKITSVLAKYVVSSVPPVPNWIKEQKKSRSLAAP